MGGNKNDLISQIEKDLEEEEKLRSKYEREISDAKIQRRKGFVQRLHLERREAGLDGVVLKAQEVASLQTAEAEQDEKLAVELKLIKDQEIRDIKMRQYIRENSHELRELESSLKSAYANKVLGAQIAENEARKAEEQMVDQRAREVLLLALGSQEETDRKIEMMERKMKEAYRRTLQDQIIAKEAARQQDFIEYIKERKLYEDTMKRIQEEEEEKRADALYFKQKIKEEMVKFNTARDVWKTRERLLIDKENEKLEAIARMKEEMVRERIEMEEKRKRLAMEEKDKIIEKMTKDLVIQNRLREERLEMIRLIKDEEFKESEMKKAQGNVAIEMMRKREMRAEFQKLLAEKARKVKEEKELDARFAEQMHLKIVEDERRDKEREIIKRQSRILDRKYNEQKIKENIQKRAESVKLNQIAIELEERERKRKLELVEEERIRILKEHAPYLWGYFPKGALKEKDLEILGMTENSCAPKAVVSSPK
ncbi:UNVERIFIED_CONTAM: hypothetical protein PYX00_007870 [Menopon gallinae]|uniref:Meiosis-specific nuclear structural protein 1 n=1 Tax=Menopon gallinae TaxID=328185 RepID=A0AAW2HKX2_9NEOP